MSDDDWRVYRYFVDGHALTAIISDVGVEVEIVCPFSAQDRYRACLAVDENGFRVPETDPGVLDCQVALYLKGCGLGDCWVGPPVALDRPEVPIGYTWDDSGEYLLLVAAEDVAEAGIKEEQTREQIELDLKVSEAEAKNTL